MENFEIPKKEINNSEEKYLVTSIVSEENNKEYFLYSDGNIYEKDEDGKLKKLDNMTPGSKKIIERIMQNFKPGRTDEIGEYVNDLKSNNMPRKKELDVDLPEL